MVCFLTSIHCSTASADVVIVNTAHFQVPTEAHILIILYTYQHVAIDLQSYLHNMNKCAHLTLLLYDKYKLKSSLGKNVVPYIFAKIKLLQHTIHSSSQLKWTIEAVKSQKHFIPFHTNYVQFLA